jgi:hypothetical protein
VNTQATKVISDWLERLGMPEYAERFAENRIDLSVLPDLRRRVGGNVEVVSKPC